MRKVRLGKGYLVHAITSDGFRILCRPGLWVIAGYDHSFKRNSTRRVTCPACQKKLASMPKRHAKRSNAI